MKPSPHSLRSKLLTVILLCWVVPVMVLIALTVLFLGREYRRTARSILETDAAGALRQTELLFSQAFNASKEVTYDGVILSAYRAYQESKDASSLYRTATDYLAQKYSRDESLSGVYIGFWEESSIVPYASAKGSVNGRLSSSFPREVRQELMDAMADADTYIRVLACNGQLYIARNLVGHDFVPFATLVMHMNEGQLLSAVKSLRHIGDIQLVIDKTLRIDGDGYHDLTAEDALGGEYAFTAETDDGHRFELFATPAPFQLWVDVPALTVIALGVLSAVLLLLPVMIVLFHRYVTRPVDTLVNATERIGEGERGYAIEESPNSKEFASLYAHLNQMSQELKEQFERLYLEQQALQQAKVRALQMQINPHFLNNTLEIINWEARIAGNDRVSDMIEALSVMLDAALDRSGRGTAPLKEELRYADAYLYIIHERLGDGLVVDKQVQEDVLDTLVPRLILQPIVENAVEHDLTPARGGHLFIRTRREGDDLVLEVEHDGHLSDADQKNIQELLEETESSPGKSGHVGLKNVHQRLRLLYGEKGRLFVENTPAKTILVRVVLPLV
ncbi:MAG: sensor histidine kinase [Clostridia bacterium]|nr:sensor histidine kinase [Clostridia bacterium]